MFFLLMHQLPRPDVGVQYFCHLCRSSHIQVCFSKAWLNQVHRPEPLPSRAESFCWLWLSPVALQKGVRNFALAKHQITCPFFVLLWLRGWASCKRMKSIISPWLLQCTLLYVTTFRSESGSLMKDRVENIFFLSVFGMVNGSCICDVEVSKHQLPLPFRSHFWGNIQQMWLHCTWLKFVLNSKYIH